MKIAIDISQVVYGTGVAVYTKNLVENLLKIDKENEYLLFGGTFRRKGDIQSIFPTAKVLPIPPTLADFLWNRLHILPIEKLIGEVDVFHSSDWSQPPTKAFRVTTIHDLAPLLYPSLFPKDIIRNIIQVHRRRLSWVKTEVDRIISPSVATKNDLVKLGLDGNKVRVIPEAPSEIFRPVPEEKIENLKRKYKISGKYLLAVGVDHRKNAERILKAFELVQAGKDLKIVFVGLPKYMNIKEGRNVRIAGYVPFDDLPIFYSGAEALVYPSLYEGFGSPILEAFASHCPVVTSNLSSMPEVAGDAAILVDPYNVASIAEGIEKALRGRKGLIEKGLKRVKQFSWLKTATETLKIYREATSSACQEAKG